MTVETASDALTSNFDTASSSFVDCGLQITVPTITDGKVIVVASLNSGCDATGETQYLMDDDGTDVQSSTKAFQFTSTSSRPVIALAMVMDADGSSVDVQVKTDSGGTLTILGSSGDFTSALDCMGAG